MLWCLIKHRIPDVQELVKTKLGFWRGEHATGVQKINSDFVLRWESVTVCVTVYISVCVIVCITVNVTVCHCICHCLYHHVFHRMSLYNRECQCHRVYHHEYHRMSLYISPWMSSYISLYISPYMSLCISPCMHRKEWIWDACEPKKLGDFYGSVDKKIDFKKAQEISAVPVLF